MTTLFALFAEVERDLISERTREGLAKARASGRKLGRPKGSLGVSRLDGKEDEIILHFLQLGVSKTAIAKITGVSPYRPLQLHDHQRAQADALACIRTRMLSVPCEENGQFYTALGGSTNRPIASSATGRNNCR